MTLFSLIFVKLSALIKIYLFFFQVSLQIKIKVKHLWWVHLFFLLSVFFKILSFLCLQTSILYSFPSLEKIKWIVFTKKKWYSDSKSRHQFRHVIWRSSHDTLWLSDLSESNVDCFKLITWSILLTCIPLSVYMETLNVFIVYQMRLRQNCVYIYGTKVIGDFQNFLGFINSFMNKYLFWLI